MFVSVWKNSVVERLPINANVGWIVRRARACIAAMQQPGVLSAEESARKASAAKSFKKLAWKGGKGNKCVPSMQAGLCARVHA